MKIKKILLKTIFFLPFYILVVLLYNVIIYDFVFGFNIVITALVLSLITVYINVFDYDKFNGISPQDYLESKHKTEVEYSEEKWHDCKRLDSNFPHLKMEAKDYSRESLQYKIHFNILIGQLNSILEFQRLNGKIIISIEKQLIPVLPDRGVNLKIIRKVEKELLAID